MFDDRNNKHARLALLLIAFVIGGPLPAQADAETPGNVSSSPVYRFADSSEVEGGSSYLVRFADAVAMELQTVGLEPNAPHTVWWVVFNDPEHCNDACDEDDLFAADGTPNVNQRADISILFADGAMSTFVGVASFSAVLTVGSQLGEWVLGRGLIDATGAEIHLVVRSHGPADPSRFYEQSSRFEPEPIMSGNCEVCKDRHFAVHIPHDH